MSVGTYGFLNFLSTLEAVGFLIKILTEDAGVVVTLCACSLSARLYTGYFD